MPRNGIAGSHGNSSFSFPGTSNLLSIVATPNYIPINSAGVSLFSHFLEYSSINLGNKSMREALNPNFIKYLIL